MGATFYIGDAIQVMSQLPEKSVDLILTSPPFLALRSYLPADHPDKALEGGSQSTPGEFIDWLIDVVEACARVLAPHGSLCFELGDTYSGSGGGGGDYLDGGWREGQAQFAGSAASMKESNAAHWRQKNSVKDAWPLAKSLSLIPESFRFAMVYGINPHTGRRTAPWRLRNVIRWVRPNPPVGALGDKFRPATSELMVFCKAKDRFFDLDAVREDHARDYSNETPTKGNRERDRNGQGRLNTERPYVADPAGVPPLDWWNVPLLEGEEETRYGPKEKPAITPRDGDPKKRAALEAQKGTRQARAGQSQGTVWVSTSMADRTFHKDGGAPPLDWWNIPPGGYPGSHYAVWPPELLIKPIKAMCPEKVCRTCGEPSRRIVDMAPASPELIAARQAENGPPRPTGNTGFQVGGRVDKSVGGWGRSRAIPVGWTDCSHDDWRPGLVLDPFAGSGTTLAVATGHGRDAIGIDLDARNYDLALERVGPFILSRG